jgi:hypothetical protein
LEDKQKSGQEEALLDGQNKKRTARGIKYASSSSNHLRDEESFELLTSRMSDDEAFLICLHGHFKFIQDLCSLPERARSAH